MTRLRVEMIDTDAKLYLDDDGVAVVAVQPGLLQPHAEAVIRRALADLGAYYGETVAQ